MTVSLYVPFSEPQDSEELEPPQFPPPSNVASDEDCDDLPLAFISRDSKEVELGKYLVREYLAFFCSRFRASICKSSAKSAILIFWNWCYFDLSHKSDLQSIIVEFFAIMQADQHFAA